MIGITGTAHENSLSNDAHLAPIPSFTLASRYFFLVLCGFVMFGTLYGLLLLPILLSMIGPPTEEQRERRTCTQSPDIRRKIRKIRTLPSHYFSKREFPRVQSDISLSVIQEESESMRSHHQSTHEIVVQPEFVVETTITNPTRTHSRNPPVMMMDDAVSTRLHSSSALMTNPSAAVYRNCRKVRFLPPTQRTRSHPSVARVR